ncbi:MAG: hypothetical protein ACLQVD_22505 [Capsulimonadaceae bacterium]
MDLGYRALATLDGMGADAARSTGEQTGGTPIPRIAIRLELRPGDVNATME